MVASTGRLHCEEVIALITVEEHSARILSTIVRAEPTLLDVMAARGMVLAEDVVAQTDLPGFDNSAMDGYAVRVDDVAAAGAATPVRLAVAEDIPAGDTRLLHLQPGTAMRIMTGAPMPAGAEAVVPVEDTDGAMGHVTIAAAVVQGRHVRRRGEDVVAGTTVLRAGSRLNPRRLALCAAAGVEQVCVFPPPRVVVMSTGDELVPSGTRPGFGQVVDSNSVMVAAMVRELGAQPFRVSGVPDRPDAVLEALRSQLVRADAVITTGGVSMGVYDAVKEALSALGTVHFTQVAMQPGKPQGFGVVGDRKIPVFALPGNPVSAFVSFEVFVAPALRLLAGRDPYEVPLVTAVAEHDWRVPQGKVQFARAQWGGTAALRTVRLVGMQGSHVLGGLADADCLAVVPAEVNAVQAGMEISCIPLSGGAHDGALATALRGG